MAAASVRRSVCDFVASSSAQWHCFKGRALIRSTNRFLPAVELFCNFFQLFNKAQLDMASALPKVVGYMTDVEGNWEYFQSCLALSSVLEVIVQLALALRRCIVSNLMRVSAVERLYSN